MITFLYKENGRVHMEKTRDSVAGFGDKEIIGIDLESPTPEERKQVETQYNIKLLSCKKPKRLRVAPATSKPTIPLLPTPTT